MMDAKTQSDPCEETVDSFVKTQFKPLQIWDMTYAATSDSTVKTLVLKKNSVNMSRTHRQFGLTGFVLLQQGQRLHPGWKHVVHSPIYQVKLSLIKACQITHRSLCIVKTAVDGNMPSGHGLLSFWYAYLADCHRCRDTHDRRSNKIGCWHA